MQFVTAGMATNGQMVNIGGASAMLGSLVLRSVSLATALGLAILMLMALFSI
jgi:hypothetical protein